MIRLLKAWRFWLLGAILGALIGSVFFYMAPPPYRARATVNVDFHLEQAWPQNTDREQFYYLERETRKLEEIAFSDTVLNSVASQVSGVTVQQLREQKLQLSQPGNGGWHFFAEDGNSQKATALASAWAKAFAQAVQVQTVNPSSGLEQFITAAPTQVEDLAAHRSVGLSIYLLTGAFVILALCGLIVLFFDFQL